MGKPSQSTMVQGDLLGGTAGPVRRLFFALQPDPDVIAQLAAVAAGPGSLPVLKGARPVSSSRYHATLHFLGDHAMPRPDIVAAARRAADTIRPSPFSWALDRVMSFHGRQPPLVLVGEIVPDPLQQLWSALQQALLREGLGQHLQRRFTPHVTLAYAAAMLPRPQPVDSLSWPVTGFSLIESVSGQREYTTLAHWPLSTAPSN